MSFAIVAAMFAAASCACNNNAPAEEPAAAEPTEICTPCDTTAAVDSAAADCAQAE